MLSKWPDGRKVKFPIVIKYSGLADGKGVFMCANKQEEIEAIAKIAAAPKERIGDCWRMISLDASPADAS